MISHHRHKQVGDAGGAHLAQCRQLRTIQLRTIQLRTIKLVLTEIEKHDPAPQQLSFLDRPELLRGGVVRRPQASSAENIVAVRNDLQALVNEMRATPEDYGGHRTAAANDLATAVVELGNALEYRQTHR